MKTTSRLRLKKRLKRRHQASRRIEFYEIQDHAPWKWTPAGWSPPAGHKQI